MRPRVTPIVALDVGDAQAAERLVDDLGESCGFYKIGSELFTAAGPGIVESIRGRGASVFLDLKFHDIPNTARGAVRSAALLGARLVTVHLAGGRAMVAAAADGSFELAGIAPGRRSVTAGAYAHDMAIVGPFDVDDGASVGPISIELSPIAPGETPKLELAGIGAALAAQGDDLLVERVLPGGGAESAGILTGDLVLAVDGTPVTALGLDGAIQRIRGPVGTRVVLKIRRATATSDITVTRVRIRT